MQTLKHFELFKTVNKSYDLTQIKYACVFLKYEAIIVDKEDNVYHLINNAKTKISKLCQKGVIDFSYSHSVVKNVFGYHILALTESGRVYGWGRNTFNQVSSADKEEVIIPERLKITRGPFPSRLSKSPLVELNEEFHCCDCWPNCSLLKSDPYEKFKLIACGFGHCMAVTKANNIIVWGNNKLGQIGNGEKPVRGNPNINVHKIIVMDEAVEPSCDFVDSLRAYSLFFTQYLPSLLPIKRFKQVNIPRKIEIKEMDPEIIAIACGSFHSLVLFRSGNLYGWGDNRYGQLGNSSKQTALTPMLINCNVKQIASTNLYTLALSNEGTLFAMGDNTYAQLGDNKQGLYKEQKEIALFKFDKISTINQLSIGLVKSDQGDQCYIWGLYKMVKESKVEANPNRIVEENEEQSLRQSNSGANLLQDTVRAAAVGVTVVAVDEGIDALKGLSHNDDTEPENEDEDNGNTFMDNIPKVSAMGAMAWGMAAVAQHKSDDTCEEPVVEDVLPEKDEEDVEKLTYIITEPTLVECNSIEKIIAKVLSLTNFTIKFENDNYNPDENDEKDIIDEKILIQVKSGINGELRKKIKILGQELRNVGKNKVKVFFGDHNKFSVISDSYVLPRGDLSIKDVNQTGQSMFDMSRFGAKNII